MLPNELNEPILTLLLLAVILLFVCVVTCDIQQLHHCRHQGLAAPHQLGYPHLLCYGSTDISATEAISWSSSSFLSFVLYFMSNSYVYLVLEQQIVRTQIPLRHRRSRLLGEFPKAQRLFRPKDPMLM